MTLIILRNEYIRLFWQERTMVNKIKSEEIIE